MDTESPPQTKATNAEMGAVSPESGAPTTAADAPLAAPAVTAQKPRRRKKWLLFSGIGIAIVLLGLGVFGFVLKGKADDAATKYADAVSKQLTAFVGEDDSAKQA